MNDLREIVDRIAGDIYGYRYQEALQLIPELTEALDRWQESRGSEAGIGAEAINEALTFLNQAIEDQDYLRLADILKYELLKTVETLEAPREVLQ